MRNDWPKVWNSDPDFALENATKIAWKDGDPKPLADLLEQRGCKEATATAQWIVHNAKQEVRWARLLHWIPYERPNDGDDDDEVWWTPDEKAENQRDMILDAIRTLPWEQAQRLFDIVVSLKPKQGKRGRRDKWSLYRLADLACDVLEAEPALLKDRYKIVGKNRKMTENAVKAQYLRAKKIWGLREIK